MDDAYQSVDLTPQPFTPQPLGLRNTTTFIPRYFSMRGLRMGSSFVQRATETTEAGRNFLINCAEKNVCPIRYIKDTIVSNSNSPIVL